MIVIFDLDGTLVDTYPLIRKSFIEVLNNHLPEIKYDEELLKSFFGPTLEDSFLRLTNNNKEQTKFLISEYRKINKVYYENEIKLFPNVIESLEKIKNHDLVILSNRVQSLVDTGLKVTGIDKYFDVVLGIDSIPRPKPHPDGLIKILDHYGSKNAVFIGDALTDIISAKNANITGIGTTWALTTKEEFRAINTEYIVDSFEELINLLEEIDV